MAVIMPCRGWRLARRQQTLRNSPVTTSPLHSIRISGLCSAMVFIAASTSSAVSVISLAAESSPGRRTDSEWARWEHMIVLLTTPGRAKPPQASQASSNSPPAEAITVISLGFCACTPGSAGADTSTSILHRHSYTHWSSLPEVRSTSALSILQCDAIPNGLVKPRCGLSLAFATRKSTHMKRESKKMRQRQLGLGLELRGGGAAGWGGTPPSPAWGVKLAGSIEEAPTPLHGSSQGGALRLLVWSEATQPPEDVL
mmetsp:Transcript_65257/g.206148  ORF Transcript_65257/g.206148 Transcript_65257/m.206148 type:complete len:256 (-) Transcript_65257:1596-2363(-)